MEEKRVSCGYGKGRGSGGGLQWSFYYSIQGSFVIIDHGGETWIEQSGRKCTGGLQWQLLLKCPDEFPSGFRWGGRGLAVDMGEAVGQGGHFNDDNPLKWSEKCP